MKVERLEDFRPVNVLSLDRRKFDVLVVYCRLWALDGGALDYEWVRLYVRNNWGYYTQGTSAQIRAGLAFVPVERWTRPSPWPQTFVPLPAPTTHRHLAN